MPSSRSERARSVSGQRKNTQARNARALGRGYDVIGDVHGCHRELVALLKQLGYSKRAGVWRHKQRKAVFVGDLVDRGPAIKEVLETVAAMVEAGSAHLILGNHERDFIFWHLLKKDGKPIREHSKVRKKQLRETHRQLGAEKGQIEHWIRWLQKQPLVFEAPGLRVVHAAWNHNAVEFWRNRNLSDPALLEELSDFKSKPSIYLERLLFGPYLFYKKDGKEKSTRVRWYVTPQELPRTTVWHAAFRRKASLSRRYLSKNEKSLLWGYPMSAPPLITGHQSLPLDAKVKPMRRNLACVDYSAVYGGRLCAYRWSEEQPTLHAESFITIPLHARTAAEIKRQKELEEKRRAAREKQAAEQKAAAQQAAQQQQQHQQGQQAAAA